MGIPLMQKIENVEEFKAQHKVAKELGDRYKYLLLLVGEYKSNEGEEYKSFEIIQGRQATYDYIKEMLRGQDDIECDVIIDISRSHIISEPPAEIIENTPRITLTNMITIYAFMKNMLMQDLVDENEPFDLDDYFDGYIEEDDDDC